MAEIGVIAVIANPDKPQAVDLAKEVMGRLSGTRGKAYLCLDHEDRLFERKVDMAVVFGGDGTVLGAVQRFGGQVPPILAFNVGRLGYLAGNAPERVLDRIDEALSGKLVESSRMMLEARLRDPDGSPRSALALNEFVLAPVRPGRMVPLSLEVDGEEVMYTRGDGIIVATPTGSTAYALSAGGPVASPGLDALIVAPICPHQLANRPLVLSPDEEVVLRHFGGQLVELTVDGSRRHKIEPGSSIEIRASTQRVRLLSPPQGKFMILREKLGWGWGEDPMANVPLVGEAERE